MTIYEELERLAPDHLRRRPVKFLVAYEGRTYTAEWLSPGRWHVWEPEYLVIPPPEECNPYLITPEGDIVDAPGHGIGKRPDGKVVNWCHYGRTSSRVPCLDTAPTNTRPHPQLQHYECSECGHHIHRRGEPVGWHVRIATYGRAYWLCPTCLSKLDALTKENTSE